jgi:hypothetical protein
MLTFGTATPYRLKSFGDWSGSLFYGCFHRKGDGVGHA